MTAKNFTNIAQTALTIRKPYFFGVVQTEWFCRLGLIYRRNKDE